LEKEQKTNPGEHDPKIKAKFEANLSEKQLNFLLNEITLYLS